MSLFRGAGRGRALLRFLASAAWLWIAYFVAEKAAHGFSRGEAFPLIRSVFTIFLLILGFGYMELAWDDSRQPLRELGLVRREGAAREFALGAAVGWGMAAAVILIVALSGHFYVQVAVGPQSLGQTLLQLCILAAGSLAAEIAFRGYPLQKLVEAIGPFSAVILAGMIFGMLRLETPGVTSIAMWVSALAAVLLSVAYLRTRALWVCWGLHFAWLASISILFGQPLAGNRLAGTMIQTDADGPTWLTGGEFGPEGSLITLIVLWIALFVLVRVTRGLAWKYNQPELKPAGIPVDVSHPMHPPAGGVPATISAQAASPIASPPQLVQIAPATSNSATGMPPEPRPADPNSGAVRDAAGDLEQ